jgi:hypothetical protein
VIKNGGRQGRGGGWEAGSNSVLGESVDQTGAFDQLLDFFTAMESTPAFSAFAAKGVQKELGSDDFDGRERRCPESNLDRARKSERDPVRGLTKL